MRMSKVLLAMSASYAIIVSFSCGATAQNYPSQAVNLVVPYTPGGIVDVFARAMGASLEKNGQSVVIENKPGASEAIAAASVARSAPDGYTLFIGSDAAFIVNELRGPTQYHIDTDFDLIMRLAEGFAFLVVRPGLNISSLDELINMAKTGTNPVTFGSEAVGSTTEFRMRQIASQSPGAKLEHIPYKGIAAVIQDLLGGRIDCAWLPPHLAKPLIDSGKVVAVATYGNKRNWMYPNIKTLQEYGYKDADLAFKMMLAAPKGTPPDVLTSIRQDIQNLLNDEKFVQQALTINGYAPIGGGATEFQDYIQNSRKLIKNMMAHSL